MNFLMKQITWFANLTPTCIMITACRLCFVVILLFASACSTKNENNKDAEESLPANDAFDSSFACLDEIPLTWKMLTNTGSGLYFIEPCEESLPTVQFADTESGIPRILYSVGIDGYSYTLLGCRSAMEDGQRVFYFKVQDEQEGDESVISLKVDGLRYDDMRTGWWRGLGGPDLLEFVSEINFGNFQTLAEVCNTRTGTPETEIKSNPKNVIDVFLTMPNEKGFFLSPQEMEENFLGRRDYLAQTPFQI